MAATILGNAKGRTALITLAETNQLVGGAAPNERSTQLARLLIWTAAASGVTVDIYDHASAATNNVWRDVVGASGAVVRELELPMRNGLRVVTSGASGTWGVVVVYDTRT